MPPLVSTAQVYMCTTRWLTGPRITGICAVQAIDVAGNVTERTTGIVVDLAQTVSWGYLLSILISGRLLSEAKSFLTTGSRDNSPRWSPDQ